MDPGTLIELYALAGIFAGGLLAGWVKMFLAIFNREVL